MNKWRNSGGSSTTNYNNNNNNGFGMVDSGGGSFLIDYQLLPFVLSPLAASTTSATSTATSGLFIPSLFSTAPGSAFLINAAAAAASIPDASIPPQYRKLFIGGLNHETNDDELRAFYSKWGHVVDCIVIRDPVSRESRGFGFVTFATPEMADAAMANRPHTIGGKIVDPKRAIPREQMLQTLKCPPVFLDGEPRSECKLILSGIHWDFHTVDALRHYFEAFGEVEQVEIIGHPRGYGFVVFEDRDSVERCLTHSRSHAINGRKIEVRETDSDAHWPPVSPLARNYHHNRRYNDGGGRHGRIAGGSLGSSSSQGSHSPVESTQSSSEPESPTST